MIICLPAFISARVGGLVVVASMALVASSSSSTSSILMVMFSLVDSMLWWMEVWLYLSFILRGEVLR